MIIMTHRRKKLRLGTISSITNPQEHLLRARNCPVSWGFCCRKEIRPLLLCLRGIKGVVSPLGGASE